MGLWWVYFCIMKDYKYIFEDKATKKQKSEFADAFSRIAQVLILLAAPTVYMYYTHGKNSTEETTPTIDVDNIEISVDEIRSNAIQITDDNMNIDNTVYYAEPVAEPLLDNNNFEEELATPKQKLQKQIIDAGVGNGIDVEYLLLLAAIESSLNPDAKASKGSASGVFQFVEQTWLEAIREYGPKYGLEKEATLIKKGVEGNPHFLYVIDKAEKKRILDMRYNPKIATHMVVEFTLKNKSFLEDNLGIEASNVNLYMVHFLGRRSATKFFKVLDDNPHWNPVDYFSSASIKHNKSIFYFRDGDTPRSFGQIHKKFEKKLEKAKKMIDISLIPRQIPASSALKPKV